MLIPLLPIVTLAVLHILGNRPIPQPPRIVPGPASIETADALPQPVSMRPLLRERVSMLPWMLFESVLLALVLRVVLTVEVSFMEWASGVGPLFQVVGATSMREGVTLMVSHLGAALYEEFLFRMLLVGGLMVFFRSFVERRVAWCMAILLGAAFFVAAHYIGPGGEPFIWREATVRLAVLFRFTAAVMLGIVYVNRGFGIAVGVHLFYNLLIRFF